MPRRKGNIRLVAHAPLMLVGLIWLLVHQLICGMVVRSPGLPGAALVMTDVSKAAGPEPPTSLDTLQR